MTRDLSTTLLAAETIQLAMLVVYASMSAVSLVMYGIDKAAARSGSRRVPELTLHLVSAVGGWPGALVGQRVFRHKTRKQPFRTTFWCTVIASCLVAAWLLVEPL